MRNYLYLSAIALILSSCNIQSDASAYMYDDVYNSRKTVESLAIKPYQKKSEEDKYDVVVEEDNRNSFFDDRRNLMNNTLKNTNFNGLNNEVCTCTSKSQNYRSQKNYSFPTNNLGLFKNINSPPNLLGNNFFSWMNTRNLCPEENATEVENDNFNKKGTDSEFLGDESGNDTPSDTSNEDIIDNATDEFIVTTASNPFVFNRMLGTYSVKVRRSYTNTNDSNTAQPTTRYVYNRSGTNTSSNSSTGNNSCEGTRNSSTSTANSSSSTKRSTANSSRRASSSSSSSTTYQRRTSTSSGSSSSSSSSRSTNSGSSSRSGNSKSSGGTSRR